MGELRSTGRAAPAGDQEHQWQHEHRARQDHHGDPQSYLPPAKLVHDRIMEARGVPAPSRRVREGQSRVHERGKSQDWRVALG